MTTLIEISVFAKDVELGDLVRIEDDQFWKITGWFVDGNGRFCIEAAGRWHRFSPNASVRIKRAECGFAWRDGWGEHACHLLVNHEYRFHRDAGDCEIPVVG